MTHSYCCKVHDCGEVFSAKSEAIKHAKKHAGSFAACGLTRPRARSSSRRTRSIRFRLRSLRQEISRHCQHETALARTHGQRRKRFRLSAVQLPRLHDDARQTAHGAQAFREVGAVNERTRQDLFVCRRQIDSVSLLFIHGCYQCRSEDPHGSPALGYRRVGHTE